MPEPEVLEAEVIGEELEPTQSSTLFRTDDPAEVLQRATETANALAPVIEERNLFTSIQGKRHIRVEGWQTLGAMLGVTPVCTWTRKLEDGWEARVEARTLDGRVIGAAEGECLKDEARWRSADDYAIRSMAQTRATSKALGSVLRFVVTLAGFEGTPAEEMDGVRPQSASDGSSGDAPPVSEKQVSFIGSLLQDANIAADTVTQIKGWALENLKGGREGSGSKTITALKDDATRDKTIAALLERAEAAANATPDVPADTEGLDMPKPTSDEDIAF